MSNWLRCPYWDCGWCLADDDTNNGSIQGACQGTDNCGYYQDVIITDRDPEIDDGK